jgi:hypothetical protein
LDSSKVQKTPGKEEEEEKDGGLGFGDFRVYTKLVESSSCCIIPMSRKLHIIKDFVKLFSLRDPSIHPSISSSIHGWHHTGKKSLTEINNPPCACVAV